MFYLSHHIGNVIIPTDFHSIIFQRGRYTTNQEWIWWMAESPGNQVVLSAPAMLRWASPSHPSIVWFVKARTVCQVNERSTRGHRMSTSELPVEKHGTMRFWGYTPKNGTIFRRANDDSPISRYPMSFPWSGRGAVGSDSFFAASGVVAICGFTGFGSRFRADPLVLMSFSSEVCNHLDYQAAFHHVSSLL